MRLSVGAKLLGGFEFVVLMAIVLGVVGMSSLAAMNELAVQLYNRDLVGLQDIAQARAAFDSIAWPAPNRWPHQLRPNAACNSAARQPPKPHLFKPLARFSPPPIPPIAARSLASSRPRGASTSHWASRSPRWPTPETHPMP